MRATTTRRAALPGLAAGIAGGVALAAAAATATLAADEEPRGKPQLPTVDLVVGKVDAAIEAAWKDAGLRPNGRCSDEEFVRGRITTAFLDRFKADVRDGKTA